MQDYVSASFWYANAILNRPDPQAISFLSNLLCSGNSQDQRGSSPAYVPYPQQLALLSTIVVHPIFTNRASTAERLEASNFALRFLRDITKTVGPVNANFTEAFAFSSLRASRSHSRKRIAPVESDSDSDELRDQKLDSKYARSESVWTQADDLWHVVGWAFNCSVNCKKRWERWAAWLDWFVSAMEADWNERVRLAKTILETDITGAKGLVQGSLIAQYISGVDGRNGRRRIMRAVLADGTQKSVNEFSEVWQNETKERKKRTDDSDKPSKKLDIDEGEFGDFGGDEDEDEVMEDTSDDGEGDGTLTPGSETSNSGNDVKEPPDLFQLGTEQLGGTNAVSLRHRLLALLFNLACELPSDFTFAEDLLDVYTEFARSLPLPHFSVLISNAFMDPPNQVCFLINLLLPLTGASPPSKGIFNVTQEQMVQDFIPRAASAYSTVDNAKVSIVLESLFMSMMQANGIEPTEELGAAVEEGVRARKAKATGDARRKGKGTTGDESDARRELDLSSERLMALLEVIEEGQTTFIRSV